MKQRDTKAELTSSDKTSKLPGAFSAQAFLNLAGAARKICDFEKSQIIFCQGDCRDVLYIQKGAVKLSVVNDFGKEAVVAIVGPVTCPPFLVQS